MARMGYEHAQCVGEAWQDMAKFSVGDIAAGQQYEQKGGFVWQVRRLIAFSGERAPHVQLVNVRDPSTTKTLSAEVLLDKNRFKRIESAAA